MIAAYAVAWVVILGYVAYLRVRAARARREFEAAARETES